MPISSWRDLPFREIWVVDFEFYPGTGTANGGREGDASTPLCLVALEMRSGRIVRQWQDEFGPFPPYRLDGDRDKGFYGLDGALRYFCEDGVDTAHKTDMRDRIIQGPQFTAEERATIMAYCEDDVRSLALLVKHMMPTIRSLPHAMARAKFMWATAQQERRGIPIDLPFLNRLRAQWSDIQSELVRELDTPFGIYEFEDGRPHWRSARFVDYIARHGMAWPTYPDGTLDQRDQTFREMAGRYPWIEPLRELRYSLSKLRLNALSVGNDGRNRVLLGAYGSKTGRNQPSNSRYTFGPAKWIRFLITPPPGRVLIHRDYCQQEVQITAVLSGDDELLGACLSGDVYLGIAKLLGFAPADATAESHKAVRTMFKTVVLGILYGLSAHSLALRIGVSLFEAGEILARLRARFRKFEAYAQSVVDHAGLALKLSTPFGWTMQCPPGINPRTVRNFPIQSTGAEILHVACILAERRGIGIVAPVHDALMAETELARADEISAALDRVMRDASAVVLRGYELRTDVQIVPAGARFHDDRGVEMWNTVERLLGQLEARSA
jgi:DNA polymerase-1